MTKVLLLQTYYTSLIARYMHFYTKNEIARNVVEAVDHDENNGHVLLGSNIFAEAGRVVVWHICVLDSLVYQLFQPVQI